MGNLFNQCFSQTFRQIYKRARTTVDPYGVSAEAGGVFILLLLF